MAAQQNGERGYERTLKMACIWDRCGHGCSPVSISTTKQPTLQMSALKVYAFCCTTSGAIQNTDPCRDGRCARLPVIRSATHRDEMGAAQQLWMKKTLTVLDLLRDTEVGDLDSALVVDEHVRALDVTVDDITLVKVVEPEEDLPDPIAHEGLFKRPIIPEQRGDGTTRHVFQEDVQVVVVDTRCYMQ